ncbi:MAG: hypothetical protein EPO21_21175 [Chloroflexota bacterium]|nr:MAG: hypothetical protein EPO21_21175 [Chloroflexota bacterium]
MKPTLPCILLTIVLMGTGGLSLAQPGDRIVVQDIKSLLKGAIEHGVARGVIVGEPATYIRQHFDTPAPIEVNVKSLHPLPQPGCHRLEVTTRQQAVLENGKREDKELVYQVSYCRDGSFPERGDRK